MNNTDVKHKVAAVAKHPITFGAIILITTLLSYWPAIDGDFIWDDDTFLTRNQLIHADDGLYRFWFTSEAPDYFPLTSTSLWLEWRLWGMNPTGYRVINIVLHAVSSILIWLVLKRLKIPGARVAAIIFALHPVNVESVAWITQRKNALSLPFYLLSIFLYLKSTEDDKYRWYVLSLVAFLLSLFSKTSTIMLPLVLLGTAWWLKGFIHRRDLLLTTPFFFFSALLGSITVWFQSQRSIGETVVRDDGILSRSAAAGKAIWFYAFKALAPFNLTFVYPRWEIDASAVHAYIPVLLFFAVMILCWCNRRTWARGMLFGLGYHAATLIPVLGFVNIYFMRYAYVADHWQYTSIIGIIALAVGTVTHLLNRRFPHTNIVHTTLSIFVIVILSVLTWSQSHIYKNPEALWRDTISKNEGAWIAHGGLGHLLAEQNRLDEAGTHFLQVLRIKPDDSTAHFNLGNISILQGRIDDAVVHFKKAILADPQNNLARMNLKIAERMARQRIGGNHASGGSYR
jgi:protein O-mannosyl-transferase